MYFVYLEPGEKNFTCAWDMSITGGLVRMALTAEIQTVVTYDGFSTRSQPILYSSPAYLIFQIKGEPTFTEDERRGEIL